MKQKTITTDKATLLVVECPKTYSLFHDDEWELIGRVTDLTEEQADNIVEEASSRPIVSLITGRELGGWYNPDGYKDYTETNISLNTCLQSLHSLLQANEVYFENALRKPSIYGSWLEDDETIFDGSGQAKECVLYHEAQSKVWDKERTYLFIKVD